MVAVVVVVAVMVVVAWRCEVSKASDERYTPKHVLDVVRAVAPDRVIWLDPCCGELAPRTALVHSDSNGLGCDWYGLSDGHLVYVNPPYSRGQLIRWANKVVGEASNGCEIVMLTPCDMGTQWAGVLWGAADGMAFWRGRIEFGSPENPSGIGNVAKQPSMFWYFGERVKAFRRAFYDHAITVRMT